jgi:autoinducer 2-degrading protein
VYVVTVDVFVKPEALEPFLAAMKDNARNSRLEPGCARFDIVQAEAEPTHIFLYEFYRTKADFEVHQTTEHFLCWRDAVADWMARPRQAGRYLGVDLTDDA